MPATTPTAPLIAQLPTFERYTAGLPNFEQIAAGLPSFDDFTAGMVFPSGEPTFSTSADPEVDTALRLSDDRLAIHTPTARTFRDYRGNPNAFKLMAEMPGPGVSHHAVLSGRYALWDLVPALVARTEQPIAELTIATLSFSLKNSAELLDMLDTGAIGTIALLVSYYFKAQNKEIYNSLVPKLRARGFPVLKMRNHAKLILAQMEDGTKYVFESSANLRSSDNVEQLVITQDATLYDFHHRWIHGELLHGKELGKD